MDIIDRLNDDEMYVDAVDDAIHEIERLRRDLARAMQERDEARIAIAEETEACAMVAVEYKKEYDKLADEVPFKTRNLYRHIASAAKTVAWLIRQRIGESQAEKA